MAFLLHRLLVMLLGYEGLGLRETLNPKPYKGLRTFGFSTQDFPFGDFGALQFTVNPIKLETGLRPKSAGISYTLLSRIEAMGFPTFGLYSIWFLRC